MFVFVLQSIAIVVFAANDEEAVGMLADQLSKKPEWSYSDDPADYWEDIAEGNITMYKQTNETSDMSEIRICEQSEGET